MKHTYFKLMRRGIRGTMARFFAIFGISLLGVGFLCGLLAATPDMFLTADRYYDTCSLFDLDIRSALGMTDGDLQALQQRDDIDVAMPARVTDAEVLCNEVVSVARIYGVQMDSEYGSAINGFELLEGRLPEAADECVLTSPNGYTTGHSVGDVVTLSPDNVNYDDLVENTYAITRLTVVGIVRSPYYVSIESEPSSVGTGSVGLVVFAWPEIYRLEVYTDIFVTLRGAAELDTFSDEYETLVNDAADKLADFGAERCRIRCDEVIGEAQTTLDEAKGDYEQAKADAENELGDARDKLDEGETALSDAQKEVADGKRQLADAEAEIADKKQELADAEGDIADAKAEMAEQKETLRDAKNRYQDGTVALESAQRQWDEGNDQYCAGTTALYAAQQQLNAEIAGQSARLEAQRPYLSAQQYAYALAAVEQARQQGQAQIDEQQARLDAAKYDLDAGRAELTESRASLAKAAAAIADGETALADAEQQIADAETKLADGRQALSDAEAEIADKRQELSDAEATIADKRQELSDAEADYADAESEADRKLSDAQTDLDAAQADIDAIELPEWIITDRSDTVSFASYKSNTEKIDAIARVFPIFFFTVAALVALTTMTRLIEEERLQMGTLKALGYSKGRILLYYLFYSVSAGLSGGVIGSVLGFRILPTVISQAYRMMYTLPETITEYYWNYALLTIAAMVVCMAGATLAACLSQLSEKAAALLLPKPQAKGKRIFLERIRFIWNRMNFTRKVTARNIFRYKKRLYMTVFGIAGCCALLVTGFGLRDSIHDIVDKQFGELYRYNLMLYLSEDSATETVQPLRDCHADSDEIVSCALFHSENATALSGDSHEKITIFLPKYTAELKDSIVLRERKSQADIPFDEDALVLTEKLCEQLGLRVGDTVTLQNSDGKKADFTVSAIAENYITSYAFLSVGAYEKAFGETPQFQVALVRTTDLDAAARDELSQKLLENDEVLTARFSETIRESFSNTVTSIDYIVVVLIVCAGALAVIVLYNLTNINICERRKELATIKVLGFHEREVASYIYRETWFLCILGILLGFAMGAWLHSFVVRTAEVDAVMFGRTAYASSYLLAALFTVVFTALVNLIMLKKLRDINMVESMKATE